ncbi:MAG: aromatic ring-hydroxylating dioxygenase subunit alpha, partial [Proteobacteria bacterium]|nr:aromatic ring-hydroxylating dioxygenase subunit alpha [Pseudomonadota bacterium]
MSFLKNFWYVGAWSHEVTDKPLARTLLNEKLVFFRTGSGDAVVFEDRCPHRFAPLSLGTVTEDSLQCGYHGFMFGADGGCTHIPQVAKVPEKIRVRKYPTVERFGWIYVWMGEAAEADESTLPPFHMMGEEGWVGSGETLELKANYQLVRDNLLDLSHTKFVHQRTLALDEADETPIEVETHDDYVSVLRVMRDVKASPFFTKAGGLRDNVVHHQYTEYWPGCNIVIRTRAKTLPNLEEEKRVKFRVLNALVPETETTTHYFWWLGRSYDQENE